MFPSFPRKENQIFFEIFQKQQLDIRDQSFFHMKINNLHLWMIPKIQLISNSLKLARKISVKIKLFWNIQRKQYEKKTEQMTSETQDKLVNIQ